MSNSNTTFNDERVLAMEHSVWEAVVRGDGDALGELFAADYMEVTLRGKRCVKNEVVTQSPEVDRIETYSVKRPKVQWLTVHIALLSYQLQLHGTCDGEVISPPDRWATSIWKYEEAANTWRCHFFQQSAYLDERL